MSRAARTGKSHHAHRNRACSKRAVSRRRHRLFEQLVHVFTIVEIFTFRVLLHSWFVGLHFLFLLDDFGDRFGLCALKSLAMQLMQFQIPRRHGFLAIRTRDKTFTLFDRQRRKWFGQSRAFSIIFNFNYLICEWKYRVH